MRSLARLRPALALLICACLAGCVSTATRRGPPLPSNLADLQLWQASGRIGVSGAQGGGGSGSFDWQQRADRADVQIRGPVGIGSVRLQVAGSVENPDLKLQTSDGLAVESQAAWVELESRLGAAVPAGSLRFWMLGIAAPGEHLWREPDADGVVTLEQGGWRIDYQRYSDDAGAHVPVRFRATSGSTRVRIVVDHWRLGQ